jgi:hypothetical protein
VRRFGLLHRYNRSYYVHGMNTFEMEWEDIATYDYEYTSPSPDSSSSVKTSQTFGKPVPEKTQRFQASYDSTFSASLQSSNNSSPASSPVLRRNDSQRDSFYDIDYDSDSDSDSEFLDDEHECEDDRSETEAIVRSYLNDAPEIDCAEALEKCMVEIYELLQARNHESFEQDVIVARSLHIPLQSSTQIYTTILQYSSPTTSLTKHCEDHLIRLASSKGTVMSSGTTESHFDIWLEDENCSLIYGWPIHAPIYRLMALRDSLQGYLGTSGEGLDDGTSLNVAGAVRGREMFLNEVLKVPVDVLLGVENVRCVLRPIEGG